TGFGVLLVNACGSPTVPPPPRPPSGIETILVVHPEYLSKAEQTLVLTLQGLVASGPSVIWVAEEGVLNTILLEQLRDEGISVQEAPPLSELLRTFRGQIEGAVLYELGTDSINVATSLCGPLKAVAVDASLQPWVEELGLPILMDVRGRDEMWALHHYQELFHPGILVEQSEEKNAHLRDFAVAHSAFTYYGLGEEDFRAVGLALGPDPTYFGWGGDEHTWVRRVSEVGGAAVPADWSRNLSVLEHVPAALPERPHQRVPSVHKGERVVAFVMSDGDNIQWMGGGFATDRGFWASPHRGSFNMTWEIAPLLAEVAPRALAYFYGTASNGDAVDDFVTGPSGIGYAFHNYLPDRVAFAQRTADAMRESDLTIATMLNSGGDMSQCVELLERPEIDGVLYKDYAPYNAREGQIFWHEGKPCVAYRYLLWEPKRANSPEGVAEAISALPADPRNDPDSYALINVHAWSFKEMGGPMEAVRRTIELLPRDTRVVTAEVFIGLLREHFGGAGG
ncbi:MAG TPA: hypothetical protein ENL34_08520, partial [Chloroflexi bacterium]|nr:hypothetical protein [Chloroflexota bacterium]